MTCCRDTATDRHPGEPGQTVYRRSPNASGRRHLHRPAIVAEDISQPGHYYDHTNHQPGANEIGSNYATSKDRVYLVLGSSIFELDAADGHLRREFRLQGDPGATPVYGGFVAVWENLLVVTTQAARYASASPRLMVYDLQTGRTLWNRPAKYGFRHNAIAVGGGRIFVIDALPGAVFAMMKRRGEKPGTASGFPRPKDTEAVPGPGTGTKRLSQNGQGHVGRSPNVEVTNGLGIGTKKPAVHRR